MAVNGKGIRHGLRGAFKSLEGLRDEGLPGKPRRAALWPMVRAAEWIVEEGGLSVGCGPETSGVAAGAEAWLSPSCRFCPGRETTRIPEVLLPGRVARVGLGCTKGGPLWVL